MRVIDLNTRDVYITPLGYHCRLVPPRETAAISSYFSFMYTQRNGGFSLTSYNVPILRKAP